METFSEKLTRMGYITDVICLNGYEYIGNSNLSFVRKSLAVCYFIGKKVGNSSLQKCSILKKVIRRITNIIFFHAVIRRYDKVDFHAIYADYIPLMRKCVKNNIPFDCTLWGSDILRSTQENLTKIEYCFEKCCSIRGAKKLLDRISEVYNCKYDNKTVPATFGNSILNNLDLNTPNGIRTLFFGDSSIDKYIVTCGYNGLRAQQHEIMLNAIIQLPHEIRERIHVVVPMTYEYDTIYRKTIEDILISAGVSYTILDQFMYVTDLRVLRRESDIVLNTQTTDAFCSALQDHLYCGNVVMIADWLDYPEYDEHDVWYIKFNEANLSEKLASVIIDYNTYKLKTKDNREKILSICSWDVQLPNWIRALEM